MQVESQAIRRPVRARRRRSLQEEARSAGAPWRPSLALLVGATHAGGGGGGGGGGCAAALPRCVARPTAPPDDAHATRFSYPSLRGSLSARRRFGRERQARVRGPARVARAPLTNVRSRPAAVVSERLPPPLRSDGTRL